MRVIYWLRKKKRIEKRDCGMCCVICKYDPPNLEGRST